MSRPRCFIQVLQQLSDDLARRVLQASTASLDHHLTFIRSPLHTLAVHASFPKLASQTIQELDFNTITTVTATVLLIEFQSLPKAKRLSLTSLRCFPLQSPASLCTPSRNHLAQAH